MAEKKERPVKKSRTYTKKTRNTKNTNAPTRKCGEALSSERHRRFTQEAIERERTRESTRDRERERAREREARETPKHPCVICGRSKDTEKQRFQSNLLGGYIHASCAKRTYEYNKARTDRAERATSGEIKSPCALCTELVTECDERVTASDNTTYIHLLCVKKAHKTMEPDDPR